MQESAGIQQPERLHKVARYDVIREIGTGGMGLVYQAYDPFQDRFVALKLPRQISSYTDYEKHFYNEANAASRLQHPNIIRVFDAGIDKGINYIAMEYIAGGATLKRYISPDNLLPLELVGQALFKCAEALDYAHRRGVIHRDIKPGNILLKDDREVKVSDFGISMLEDPDMVDTQQTVTLVGSPRYMAPERINESGATHKSDIFSLGVVMYEVLTGHPPFQGDTIPALIQQIMNVDPLPPSSYRGNLPPQIDNIVLKAIAKGPDDRYSSMLAFAADLSICFSQLASPRDTVTAELRTEKLKRLSFFNDFHDAEIWELLRWAEWRGVDDGQTIIREGDMDDAVYLLVSGEAEVSKDGKSVAVLKAGEVFGEIAFLGRQHRSATVKAKGLCDILRLNIEQLEKTSAPCQIQFQRVFISTLIKRLVHTTEQLVQFDS